MWPAMESVLSEYGIHLRMYDTVETPPRSSDPQKLSLGAKKYLLLHKINKNCTGLAQIMGQLYGSNRDFQSKC
jgi:hypothetical protein